MNREIKFRAWDIEAEEMRDWSYILNNLVGNYEDVFNDEHFFMLQFTGLKDKNGVEIYEGDIVKYAKETNLTSESTYILGGEVYYDNLTASYRMKETLYPLIFKGYEVIGNIYEHSHLLT